jgi:hypothetical protein
MIFGLSYAQGIRATSLSVHSPLLIPPPPSAPYWTYKTGFYVPAVAVSEDGNTIVAASDDNKIYTFGRGSNTTLWRCNEPSTCSVAVSANGSTIVAVGSGVHVFGRQSNTTIWDYFHSGGAPLSVAVSADGNTIVSGGFDNNVTVFSRQSNATIWRYNTVAPIYSVAVSANGSTIVAGGSDGYVRVFGRQSNTIVWQYGASNNIYSVAVSADGNTIAAGGADGYIRVFGRQSNATIWDYFSTNKTRCVAVSRDGTTIAAGGDDGYLRVFGRTSNATLIQHNTGGTIARAVATSSDGSMIACGGHGANNPRVFMYSKSLGLLASYDVGGTIGGSITFGGPVVGISGDGSLMAIGCNDNKLYVFQYDTTPPVLGTPSVVPSSPVGGQTVNISVSVTDNLGVSTVTLHYRDEGASSWSSVAMSLVGSVYTARIGPFTAGATIYYYVTATDSSGNTASSPADAPLSYRILTIGSAPGIEWTSVLVGAALGAVIAIVVSFVLLRGKRRRR